MYMEIERNRISRGGCLVRNSLVDLYTYAQKSISAFVIKVRQVCNYAHTELDFGVDRVKFS